MLPLFLAHLCICLLCKNSALSPSACCHHLPLTNNPQNDWLWGKTMPPAERERERTGEWRSLAFRWRFWRMSLSASARGWQITSSFRSQIVFYTGSLQNNVIILRMAREKWSQTSWKSSGKKLGSVLEISEWYLLDLPVQLWTQSRISGFSWTVRHLPSCWL